MRKAIAIGLKVFIAIGFLIAVANVWVVWQTKSDIHSDIDDVPANKLALVLGTSKYSIGGGINPFFKNRILAAAKLYKAGKVKHILVSGDNRTVYYNEPKTMMEELVRSGVPEKDITLDSAGLRTLDSIIRCKEVFGQDQFIIVTQKFHSYRAIFISQHYGLKTTGFIAGDIAISNSPLLLLREIFARPLAIIDLFILGTSPKSLEDKEDLNILR